MDHLESNWQFKKTFFKGLAKTALVSALLFGTSSGAQAEMQKFTFIPGHTAVNWFVDHQGFSTSNGKFPNVTGTLWLDEKNPSKSKVEAFVNVLNQDTGNTTWNFHLSTPDWLNSARFGEASFISDKVVMKGKDRAQVHGVLNFRGISKPLVLDVKLNKIGNGPMSGKKTVGFSATGKLNRKDFGMVAYADPGMVGTEVKLVIDAEAEAE